MQDDRTALHMAAQKEKSELVELLLEHKASVDVQDKVMRAWACGGRGLAW